MSGETTTERNQRRLRDAAERLLAGQARTSDGKLTLKSLAAEAGLPRQYLYRDAYKAIAHEFDEGARRILAQSGTPDERVAEIERLKKERATAQDKASKHRRMARLAREEVRLAASQIAYLTAQNNALREQLDAHAAITSIDSTPSPRASRKGRE